MKKTLTVNLNGRVFNIDEDAYQLLDDYLKNLRIYFRKENDSSEIINDFEARIEELFSEKIESGYQVITISDVQAVIERMGKPEDFENDDPGTEPNDTRKDDESKSKKIKKKYYRDIDDKMLGGVCSGISNYFGWDPTPVRLIFFLCIFFTSGWIVPIYLILWLLVPAAKTVEQKLEMKGEEVTLENIGKAIAEYTTGKTQDHPRSYLKNILDFIAAILKICMVGLGIIIGISLAFAFFIVIIVLVSLIFGMGSMSIPFMQSIGADHLIVANPILVTIILALVLGIPLFSLIYMIISYFGKFKPLSRSVKVINLTIWILAFIALICLGFNETKRNWNNGLFNNFWYDEDSEHMEGNGIVSDIHSTLPSFENLRIDNKLIADIQLIYKPGDSAQVSINGDSNIIDKIAWKKDNNTLEFFVKKGYNLNPTNKINIRISAPQINGIKLKSIGNIIAENKITTDTFNIELIGAGSFKADSLECKYINAKIDGVGAIIIGGKSQKSILKLKGTGKIDALNLEADSVFAKVKGVGAINTNPQLLLDASVDGVGQITYKNDPQNKNFQVKGLGKIISE